VVHGDAKSSKLIGRRIEQVELPEGVSIGAVVRGEQVHEFLPSHEIALNIVDAVFDLALVLVIPNSG
jgi:trk system potassium uptake protein TrkA